MWVAKYLAVIVIILSVSVGVLPVAAENAVDKKNDQQATTSDIEMNGMRFADYRDFYNKWPLVTATYRTDNHEMRFIYANPLAYEVLKKGSADYPDGAVFGKMPSPVISDPAFAYSLTPTGATRYQFMLRDKKKFAKTGGWGFAVFDISGQVAPSLDAGRPSHKMSHDDMSAQCVACHENVRSRNYVFARLPEFDPAKISAWAKENATVDKSSLRYSDYGRDQLPERVRRLVPDTEKTVRFIEGNLRDKAYIFIAYEIRPALIQEAVRSGLPAMLLSVNGNTVSLVERADPSKEPTSEPCDSNKKLYVAYSTIGVNPDNWVSKDLFCLPTGK